MQLKNNDNNLRDLHNIITDYYYKLDRIFLIYEHDLLLENDTNGYYVRWLLDRKHVFEYKVIEDRGMQLSIISKAIGPNFFSTYDFMSYDNAERFSLSVDKISILRNLKLLDEFIFDN